MLKTNFDKYEYSESTTDKRRLLPKFLNRPIIGVENQIFIRENIDKKDRYQVFVTKIGDKYNYLYSRGALTATKVFEVAERYNINML